MLRKILKLLGLIALVLFVIVTLAFTSKETKNVTCRNIEITFSQNELIKLDENEITRLVKSADKQLIGKNLRLINAELIEKEVEKHQAILSAEVFKVLAKDSTSYAGILGVKVKHREPAVRIISSSGNYYLDNNKVKVPVSANYTANVLVATGYFSEQFAKEQLLPFVLDLEKDGFWKAQAKQLHVEQDGNVIITPLVGDHLIELGTLDDYPEKLRNMKAFYKQVMANNKWNKYQTVSLKYKNQIIAKKKS
jgi:cell division protein FtsQ